MEIHSAAGRADGITDSDLQALAGYQGSAAFSEPEQAALAYAGAMVAGSAVSDELFARVRSCFSEEEIIELTALIAFEICAAKFNRALEIEGQGVCILKTGASPKQRSESAR